MAINIAYTTSTIITYHLHEFVFLSMSWRITDYHAMLLYTENKMHTYLTMQRPACLLIHEVQIPSQCLRALVTYATLWLIFNFSQNFFLHGSHPRILMCQGLSTSHSHESGFVKLEFSWSRVRQPRILMSQGSSISKYHESGFVNFEVSWVRVCQLRIFMN